MILYKAQHQRLSIRQVEVDRRSATHVYRGQDIEAIACPYHSYHDTWEAARDQLILVARSRLNEAKNDLIRVSNMKD